jgi:hypothetical protein
MFNSLKMLNTVTCCWGKPNGKYTPSYLQMNMELISIKGISQEKL